MPTRHAARLIGVGLTPLNAKPSPSPSRLMQQALDSALQSVNLQRKDITGLIAIPSLAAPHFMEVSCASLCNSSWTSSGQTCPVSNNRHWRCWPVTGLLSATRMVTEQNHNLVAVVAGDSVKGLDSEEFLKRADATCGGPDADNLPADYEPLPSPVIPNGYDRVARYQMKKYGLTRNQLAACSALMSMAARHPHALTKSPRTIQDVLESQHVAPVTSVLECARRADGGAALLVASSRFMERMGLDKKLGVVVVGGGEASGLCIHQNQKR
ncbi:hypothetical protein BCR33DRAFT_848887 [Rhizoclosmatium globosum]|uniref:Thiolase N-terminal domain-containing protein n=1 Tax=Rhizoclosmatium globosum TaxID=329046 RepID=A0A1Y2CIR7_9FUNG|nr:hypothetical protein BCR33DRAFT_848887 [Rhizoclosmatium globosum]|eukprot:ORY46836.1 hypothetical protein BCR33DRAFT_848887 [Rhizoclosmatium globosum]